MKKVIFLVIPIWVGLNAFAQDLVSGGSNSWILHTPDDGRTTMYVAPKIGGSWDWSKSTTFSNNGNLRVPGSIAGRDLISEGSNSWIFHTPDDGRTTFYLAPKTGGSWDWSKNTSFYNNGNVRFSGAVHGKDLVSEGSNSWIFHTPDDGRTTFYLAPKKNGAWDWSKKTSFLSNGKVIFSNNIAVKGKIESKEIIVSNTPTADFVFNKNYDLPPLEKVEKFIRERCHLPDVASAAEMEMNGVSLGDFQIKLLQKIEELTLYTINQQKEIEALRKENVELNRISRKLLDLQKKVEILESDR